MTEANCVDGEQQEKHKKVLMSLASAPKAKKNTLLITFETRSCTNGPRQQRGDKEGSPDQSTHIGNGDVSGCKRLCDAPHTWVRAEPFAAFCKSTGLHPLGERGRHSFWRDRCSCRTTSPRPGSTLTQVKLGPCENASLLAVSGSRVLKLLRKSSRPKFLIRSTSPAAQGLMSFGSDLVDLGRDCARVVAEIFNGANPANIPDLSTTNHWLFGS